MLSCQDFCGTMIGNQATPEGAVQEIDLRLRSPSLLALEASRSRQHPTMCSRRCRAVRNQHGRRGMTHRMASRRRCHLGEFHLSPSFHHCQQPPRLPEVTLRLIRNHPDTITCRPVDRCARIWKRNCPIRARCHPERSEGPFPRRPKAPRSARGDNRGSFFADGCHYARKLLIAFSSKVRPRPGLSVSTMWLFSIFGVSS